MARKKILSPTKQRGFNKKIYGFDIETYDNNRKFLCGSIYDDDNNYWYFTDRFELINFLKTKRFKRSIICATNLGFDFFGTFFGTPDIMEFNTLFRGSSLIYAKTFIANQKFNAKRTNKHDVNTVFIDTMNYCAMSVEKAGELINIPKLSKPSFLGKKPKTKEEWEIIKEYNINDSKVSKMFLKFLFDGFLNLGATPKITIASTSMSLFRNKYLKDNYYRAKPEELLEMFEAYYGGRTEVFKRGYIEDYNYYDFNSLYPDVMRNEYPDPNFKRVTRKNTDYYINTYHGCSNIDIDVPYSKHPLLPKRHENKLVFPTGKFSGWYSHIEIREAVNLGAKILKVHKTYYFKKTCTPFKEYVDDLYKLRNEYKSKGSAMEKITKLFMNSLYGKFGQKFTNVDNVKPFNLTLEELHKLKHFDRLGDFIRIKEEQIEPSVFCIPIWALYTTAYARLKLHKAIVKHNPVYCDTDSLITKDTIETSNELGALKLEMHVEKGIIVKPKFYMTKDGDTEFIKIKGVAQQLSSLEFKIICQSPTVLYTKFTKFKESLRRDKFLPNELQEVSKNLNMEDNKRIWQSPKFDFNILEDSEPLNLNLLTT